METEIELSLYDDEGLGSVIFKNISRHYSGIKQLIEFSIDEYKSKIEMYNKTKHENKIPEIENELNKYGLKKNMDLAKKIIVISASQNEKDVVNLEHLMNPFNWHIIFFGNLGMQDYIRNLGYIKTLYETLKRSNLDVLECFRKIKEFEFDEFSFQSTEDSGLNFDFSESFFDTLDSINPYDDFSESFFENLENLKNINLSYAFYDSLDEVEADKNKEKFNKYLFAVAVKDKECAILKDLDNELS